MRLLPSALVQIAVLVGFSEAAGAAAFTLNQTTVNLFANAGGSTVSDSSTTLTNDGSGSLSVTLSSSSTGNWLSASISPNPVPGLGTATITVTANPAKLNPGNYTGTVTVSGGGTTAHVTVTVNVSGVTITASPNSISIGALQAGTQQQTQIHVTGSATVQISAAGGAWLSVNPTNISSPATFTATVDASALSLGMHSGSITLQCVSGSPCVPVVIAVNVNVVPAPLTVTTTSPLPSGTVNSPYQGFTLTATGGIGPYTWTVLSGSFPTDLHLSPSGAITGTPTVVAQITGFQFTVQVQDSAGNSANSALLTIKVFGQPTLTVSPTVVNLSTSPGTASSPQTVHITINTIDPITANEQIAYQKGSQWLGVSAGVGFDYQLVGFPFGLSPDTYSAVLTLSCTGCAQSPAHVQVNFTVNPGLQVTPSSLNFQVSVHTMSAPKPLSIGTFGGSLSFSAVADPWIIVTPSSGTATGSPQSLNVTIDATSLSAGPHSGNITISCSGGNNCSPVTIPVTATVAAATLTASAQSLTFQAAPNGALPASQTINVTASDSEPFSFTYSPQGSWLNVTANRTTTDAVLTATVVSIPAQTSTGSITITPANGTSAITIQVTLTLTTSPATVIVTDVMNNSSVIPSGFPNSGIAPSTLFVVRGAGLAIPGSTPILQDSTKGLPTTLNGASITISAGGKTYTPGLYYAIPTQIAGVLPAAAAVGSATLTVSFNGANSVPFSFNVVASAFGMDTYNGNVVLLQDAVTGAIITPTNSAQPNQPVTIWGTGLGADPGDSDTNYSNSPQAINTSVQVYIGTVQATNIRYAGSFGYPGVHGIVFDVPANIPSGCFVSIAIVTGGTTLSNVGTGAFMPNGGVCQDPYSGLNGSQVASLTAQATVNLATILLKQVTSPPTSSAAATFQQVAGSSFVPATGQLSAGNCSLNEVVTNHSSPASTALNPGAVTVTPPSGGPIAMQANQQVPGEFDAQTPNSSGAFTIAGGGGSASPAVGPFTTTISLPAPPLAWTNQNASATVIRNSGQSFTWTGGAAGSYVVMTGTSSPAGSGVSGSYTCIAPVSAGGFNVPNYILSGMPAGSGTTAVVNSTGYLPFSAAGIDFGFGLGLAGVSVNSIWQ